MTGLLLALLAVPFCAAEPVAETLARCTVRSPVGPISTPITMEAADFLLDHPDMTADIVRRRGLAPYRIEMRGPKSSWADDGDGTRGLITLVERQGGRRVYFVEGTHDSPFFPPIRAAAVILLESAPSAGAAPAMTSSLDVCVKVHNRFLSGMVKVLKPFLRKTIIRKFAKAFSVAQRMGELLAKEPGPVSKEILAHPSLSEEDRTRAKRVLAGML